MKPPARKRTLIEVPVTDSYKERILENEKQKVEIQQRIDSKLEVIAENVTSSTGLMVGKLELLISNQNILINLMSSMIFAGMQPINPLPIYLLQLIYPRDTNNNNNNNNNNNIFQQYSLSPSSRKKINFACEYNKYIT